MDLCGPMCVASVNGKKHILVIVDGYFRFMWVKCLRSKDEAPDFIIKFLKMIQLRLKAPVRLIRTDIGTEFVNQTLREYYEKVGISHETSVARSPQQNGVVERRNHMLIEAACTMLIYVKYSLFLWAEAVATTDFDELTAMASKHKSLEPVLHEMTPATISSGLVPNLPPSTSYVPTSRTDYNILFQPLFDELLTPPPSVDLPALEVIALISKVVASGPASSTGLPSSTTVDQDAPSPIEPKTYKDALTQACWIEAMQEELNEFEHLEVWELVPHPDNQPDGFVDKDNLNHVCKLKKALYGLKQAPRAWYDLSSKFLLSHEFSKGTVDPTLFIRKQDKDILLILQSPRGIFLNQLKYALESLKKYGMQSSDLVDTPMVEKSKLDEDPQEKAVDPTHYRGMVGTLMYLTAKQVENGVVELYFVNTEYQLADIFTKALCRERFEFLINKLGMRCFTPETLQQLADEDEE
nr:hypothetical protein [Tanacetum cinerariifolium]